MEFVDYITYFLSTETPFMLLFVALFFYVIKTNVDREKRLTALINSKLDTIDKQLEVLIKVWKILIEKELEGKKDE